MNVYTVGTFDLLHVEHPALLEYCSTLGDVVESYLRDTDKSIVQTCYSPRTASSGTKRAQSRRVERPEKHDPVFGLSA